MNSLMTSRSSRSDEGYSVVSSICLVLRWRVGAVCDGDGGERVSALWCFVCRGKIFLFSKQMMFSESIGVDVTMTGTVGVSSGFFSIGGDSSEGNSGTVSGRFCGLGTCILKDRVFAS